MRASLVFTLLLGSAIGFAADSPLQAVFQRMDKASADFKGFTANLVKIDHSDIVDANDKSEGTIAVRRVGPHNVQVLEKIDTLNGKPDGEQLELGTRFSVYHPKENLVIDYDLNKKYRGVEEAALALLGGSSKDLLQDYKVTYGSAETVEGKAASRLVLNPIDQTLAQQFPKIEVWISDATGLAVQEKLYQKGEKDYELQTYSNVQPGNVSDDQVKMNVPKNTRHQHQKQ
jgi:outer membrane lipoprotein-sorting protein